MIKAHRSAHGRIVRRRGRRPAALLAALALVAGLSLTSAAASAADGAAADQAPPATTAPVDGTAGTGQRSEADASLPTPGPSETPDDAAGDDAAADETAPSDSGAGTIADEADDSGQADQNSDDEESRIEDAGAEDTDSDTAATEKPAAPDEKTGEQPDATDKSRKAAGDAVTSLSVPPATDTSAVITAHVGGSRTGGSSVADLAGLTLRLYDGGGNGPSAPVGDSWAVCVSDSDGDCSFTVPNTQEEITERGECVDWNWLGWCTERETVVVQEGGENHDRRFWVVATDAPNGWYLNTALTTSGGEFSYAFRTPSIEAGETYRSGDDFMASDGSRTSSGTWQASHVNPSLPTSCQAGISTALILDLSGSVADAGALDDLQQAGKDMVDALAGTGSSMALYTFADSAPRNGGSGGQSHSSMPIDAGGNATTIKNRIDGYEASGSTNWDEGIWDAAADQAGYDLAIVITDGFATTYRSGGDGRTTRFIETENAVYSANALKAQGTRVLAVGVGDGTSGSAANLRAVSGQSAYGAGVPAQDADYFQSEWSELAGLLEDVAHGATCQATIEVAKNTLAYGADAPVNGGAGWEFSVGATNGELSPSATQTTDASGTVAWALRFDSPSPEPASVSLEELFSQAQLDDGWALDEVACTVNATAGDPQQLSVTAGDRVECVVLNAQSLVPGISVIKTAWDTPTADGLAEATEIPAGDAVTDGTVVTWTYTVTNTGETHLYDIAVADDRVGAAECPADDLAPDASMTCTASGPVTALP